MFKIIRLDILNGLYKYEKVKTVIQYTYKKSYNTQFFSIHLLNHYIFDSYLISVKIWKLF